MALFVGSLGIGGAWIYVGAWLYARPLGRPQGYAPTIVLPLEILKALLVLHVQ